MYFVRPYVKSYKIRIASIYNCVKDIFKMDYTKSLYGIFSFISNITRIELIA